MRLPFRNRITIRTTSIGWPGRRFPNCCAGASRPTADILLPTLDAFTLGQLFQMFMLATVLEGRLIGINPYGQPGVEAYKNNMQEILDP